MNTTVMNNKLDKEMNKSKKLKSIFEKISKAESNLYDIRHKFFNTLSLIKETDNTDLSSIYTEIATTMISLEEKRKELFILIDSKIIPSTVNLLNSAKELKKGVSNYVSLKKENDKKEKERQKAASNNDKDRDQLIQQEIQSGQDQLNNEQVSNEDGVLSFEKERIMNNKYLMLHYIHSELALHAAAVELLSKAYTKIFNLFPISHLPEFVKEYDLNLNNNELANFGYDKKKFKKKVQQEPQNNRNFGMIQQINNNSNINNDNSNIGGSNIGGNKRNFIEDSFDGRDNRKGRKMPNDDEFGDGDMAI